MTDILERIDEALEGYDKNHYYFGAEIARDTLGFCAFNLLPEAKEEIERLRKELKKSQDDADDQSRLAYDERSAADYAEAKLAVAVEALEPFAKAGEAPPAHGTCIYNPPEGVEYSLNALDLSRARAALAEIKGEKQ